MYKRHPLFYPLTKNSNQGSFLVFSHENTGNQNQSKIKSARDPMIWPMNMECGK